MTVARDFTTPRDVSTGDAAFQAWGTMIHNALSAVGLVQTGDSGQLNVSTMTAPAGGSFATGYEIWRFNDQWQSGDPIYFKLEYGRASTTSRGTLRFTIGTGSDGAGNITNASSTTVLTCQTPSTTTPPELHVCYTGDVFILEENTGQTTISTVILIERFRDQNGSIITSGAYKGFAVLTHCGPVGTTIAWERRNGAWTTNRPCYQHGYVSMADSTGKKKVGCKVLGDNNPFAGIIYVYSVSSNDGAAWGDTLVVHMYGQERTYRLMYNMSSGSFNANADYGATTGNYSCLPMLLSE